jgi:hypothetical protein
VVQFLLVYIAESHAVDEWPVGETIIKKQHTTLDERIVACQECLEDFGLEMPTVVDTIDNEFHRTFSCWPIRFYLIRGGVLEYVARPRGCTGYDLSEITDWLDTLCQP